MTKIRILKRQNKPYIELPEEIINYDELELFKLKEGYYLISVPLSPPSLRMSASNSNSAVLNENERLLMRKLLSIRFEKRVPPEVSKILNDDEKKTLKEMERKGYVNIFRGAKYKDGVYNINDDAYRLLLRLENSTQQATQQQPAAVPHLHQVQDPFMFLKMRGFLIVPDKNEAKVLSEKISQSMKAGEALGIKGFDGRFYIMTNNYFQNARSAIMRVLVDDMTLSSLAAAAKLDSDGCLAALRMMSENGEILEKRKGIFALA